MKVHELAWDSNVFGFRVGRLDIARDPDVGAVCEAVRTGYQSGCELVYVFSPGSLHGDCIAAAGLLEMGTRVSYAGDAPAAQHAGAGTAAGPVVRPAGKAELETVVRLSLLSGERSRFRVDPAIPEAVFTEIYTAWGEKSLRGELADIVLLAGADGDPVQGMVTAACNHGTATIGLVAVAREFARRGVGRALLLALSEWAAVAGCRRVSVATQGDNAAARSLYRACGMREYELLHVYHAWRRRALPPGRGG